MNLMQLEQTAEANARSDRERLARLDRRRLARAAQGLPEETPEEAGAAVAALMAAPAAPPPAPGAPTELTIEHLERFVRDSAERSRAALEAGDERGAIAAADTAKAGASLLIQLRSTLSGSLDAKVLMGRQPTAAQLAMPGRRPVVAARAAEAVAKTKWAFMSPTNVLGSLVAIYGSPTPDALELEHRVLHFLAYGNLARDGLQAAAFVSRLVRAGKAALRVAAGSGSPGDERAVAEMRAILTGFLERARAAV